MMAAAQRHWHNAGQPVFEPHRARVPGCLPKKRTGRAALEELVPKARQREGSLQSCPKTAHGSLDACLKSAPAGQHWRSWCRKPDSAWILGCLPEKRTGRAALEELVPKARARARPKLPATLRGLAAPRVHTRRTPGSTRPPRMTRPASTVSTHRARAARVAPREQVRQMAAAIREATPRGEVHRIQVTSLLMAALKVCTGTGTVQQVDGDIFANLSESLRPSTDILISQHIFRGKSWTRAAIREATPRGEVHRIQVTSLLMAALKVCTGTVQMGAIWGQ